MRSILPDYCHYMPLSQGDAAVTRYGVQSRGQRKTNNTVTDEMGLQPFDAASPRLGVTGPIVSLAGVFPYSALK